MVQGGRSFLEKKMKKQMKSFSPKYRLSSPQYYYNQGPSFFPFPHLNGSQKHLFVLSIIERGIRAAKRHIA
jgi:hypothetical protein